MVKGTAFTSSKTSQIAVFLLVMLWSYTAASELVSFDAFQLQIYGQPLPHGFVTVLIWSLPLLELVTASLLVFHQTRIWGLLCSLLLLTCFTTYAAIIVMQLFGQEPTTLMVVYRGLSWNAYLYIHLFFVLLSLLAIKHDYRERRLIGTD